MSVPGRQAIFQLHLWSALVVGAVLVFVAITGALMVFRPELDPRLNRELFAVKPAGPRQSLDSLIASARKAYPAGKVDFARYAGAADVAVQVAFLDKQVVFVDPYSAEVLGRRGRYEGFFGRCEQLHRFLWLGAPGKFIIRACAMLTVVVLLTGFYLWLPPVLRVLKSGLTLDFQLRGRAWNFNLHKVVGIYAGGVVLVSALTGLPQSFDWMNHGTYQGWGAAPAGPALHSVPPPGSPEFAPMQGFLDQALRAMPQFRTLTVLYPRKPDSPVEIYAVSEDAPHGNARSYFFFDAYSGALLRSIPYAEGGAGYKFYFTAVSLHFGQVAGLIGRLVVLAGTMAVPILAVTGLGMFLQRRSRRRAG